MKRLSVVISALFVVVFTVGGCGSRLSSDGWITLIDGEKGLENWNRIGDANWRAEGGAIVADKGKGGHLVTKNSYKDFEIYAEFWADQTSQSGIYLRASNPKQIGTASAYEVNIYDQRPGAEYSTGAIVNFASVPVPPIYKTGGKWNTYRITAKGPELTVAFNGIVTAHISDNSFKQGPFSLQFGNRGKQPGGPIKWRLVQVRPL